MTEQELRALVREAIARHAASGTGREAIGASDGRKTWGPPSGGPARRHVSHAMFTLPAGGDTDGACLIEPAVACNHCGFCKSYGH